MMTKAQIRSKDFKLRPAVAEFAAQLEEKLRKNDDKGGWEICSFQYLIKRLEQEVEELKGAETTWLTNGEAIDVAAFAMMIWENNMGMK
jgi:hypothetical protein